MKNNKLIFGILVLIIVLGLIVSLFYPKSKTTSPINTPGQTDTTLTYTNTDYGFTFSLPNNWKGYSVVKNTWKGSPLNNKIANEEGPKLLIRNPNWTSTTPYEDIPIMIFTLEQWGSYTAENFNVSAAPIPASEIARNNLYVFALPPRWDFDYSKGFEDAENIMKNNPPKAFNIKR